jgi:(E)-4-hydroxy-3-methylbut-2-enyl-diphosphate synthase
MFVEDIKYCVDLFERKRLPTKEVIVGNIVMGGENPICIQSMTTTDTMNTDLSVAQSIRMITAGCEIVRLTAPSKKEAENLREIKKQLRGAGYSAPLVADIHFTPNAAEIAATIVEKVRVNPGNYADKKKFEEINYTDNTYNDELLRIEEKFTPLVLLCKKHGTAMRIGTNHGSLSDRILSRYGDTPEGMVESAMEFIRICEKNNFDQLVVSMKASNTLVMVQAYRLLCSEMIKNDRYYPLHLGVTEAGDGEDGRIKSAVGIGALLVDGIGDTIRVSLTEEPEHEIPVAQKLVAHYSKIVTEKHTPFSRLPYNPFEYSRRESKTVHNIGGKNVPVVIADFSKKEVITPANLYAIGYNYSIQLDKWHLQDQAADYIYIGENTLSFEVPGTLGILCSLENWKNNYSSKAGFYPVITVKNLLELPQNQQAFCFITNPNELSEAMADYPNLVLVAKGVAVQNTHFFRNLYCNIAKLDIKSPIILFIESEETDQETFQIGVSSDLGSSLIDGFGDGLWISATQAQTFVNSTAFGILQATRTRISKTEYISCPSCGRTLFDLQETTAKIRARTAHLKGLKIGIMGCIVNGPGEMADADYGYVGTGPGKIHLYKEKTVVRKNVNESEAVQALIDLIKEHGDWVEAT